MTSLRLLGELGVPSFAFIGGLALGGGLEIALHCTYRSVAAGTTALGLPEALLGLVPGWGGCYLLPRLVGAGEAYRMIVDRPLGGNRFIDATTAVRIGLVDVVLPDEDFVETSLGWAGERARRRCGPAPTAGRRRDVGCRDQPPRATDSTGGCTVAPRRPTVRWSSSRTARDRDRDTAFAAEDDALTELLDTDELRAGLYALDLTTRRARTPAGAPDPVHARQVTQVGIVGAGLMAAQLAVLLGGRLGVPVRMREVDAERAVAGRQRVRDLVERAVRRGRTSVEAGDALLARVTVGTELADLAGCDLVRRGGHRGAGRQAGGLRRARGRGRSRTRSWRPTPRPCRSRRWRRACATPSGWSGCTSSTRWPRCRWSRWCGPRAPTKPRSPRRSRWPRQARKTAVLVADRPGFVVNRLLLRELAEVLHTVETGTPVEVADAALRPLGLPMGPFALLQLVGLPVALHVLEHLHEDLGARYPLSPGLRALADAGRAVVPPPDGSGREADVDPAIQDAFGAPGGDGALDEPGVLDAVLTGLAQEVTLMLDEGVVVSPEQIDLAMILGAGFAFHLGGLLPYLERTGRITLPGAR